ncbi:unnamed protein product, partial [Polarella glacialis]
VLLPESGRSTCPAEDDHEDFCSHAVAVARLDAELVGLKALRRFAAADDSEAHFVVPQPIELVKCPSPGGAALLLPWLNLKTPRCLEAHGTAVAALHSRSLGQSESFGFAQDTFCGRWRLRNCWGNDWVSFFQEQRLQPLLRAAMAAADRTNTIVGPATRSMAKLEGYEALRALFRGADMRPCLLHGDLWRGNFVLEDGKPVLLDPAASWGHSEMDVAQVKLLEAPESYEQFMRGYYGMMR